MLARRSLPSHDATCPFCRGNEHETPEATLIRGWSGHPYAMVQELDSSFDAVAMVGVVTGAATGAEPAQNPMLSNPQGSHFI